jgi:NAD(P)-dependent dehydrogenase (short-subunit alcohol dehydrogenase family)
MHWRTALVTGASRGIGLALAQELLAQGTQVHVVSRSRVSLSGATSHVCDVADAEAIAALVRSLGELDLVIANAGVGAAPGRRSWEWETFRDALQVNLNGAAATLTAGLAAMVARGSGHLVSISSLASFGALPSAEAYCVPKAGLNMLMDCLALDLEGTGVKTTNVYLGFVRTQMLTGSTHSLPQLMEPEEVAPLIVRKLKRAPRSITLPRALALAARVGSVLPGKMKRALSGRR